MAQKDKCFSLFPKSGRGTGFVAKSGECERGRPWRELRGLVETVHGYVAANSFFYQGGNISSCVSIIKDGKHYHRFFDKEYTARGLVTKAKQFAAEVFKAGKAC